jgi:hypothetical protein
MEGKREMDKVGKRGRVRNGKRWIKMAIEM